MSKQLAISSTFATFAMAAMLLANTPAQHLRGETAGFDRGALAELSVPGLPQVRLLD